MRDDWHLLKAGVDGIAAAYRRGRDSRRDAGCATADAVEHAKSCLVDPDQVAQAYWFGWLAEHESDQWHLFMTEGGTSFHVRILRPPDKLMHVYEAHDIRLELYPDTVMLIDERGTMWAGANAAAAIQAALPVPLPIDVLCNKPRPFLAIVTLETFAHHTTRFDEDQAALRRRRDDPNEA